MRSEVTQAPGHTVCVKLYEATSSGKWLHLQAFGLTVVVGATWRPFIVYIPSQCVSVAGLAQSPTPGMGNRYVCTEYTALFIRVFISMQLAAG